MNLPLQLKLKFNQAIQRYSGPYIGFTFGNLMELTSLNVFNVNFKFKFILILYYIL